mmetsp:Transcript_43907/g.133741  ORF Transcript_43907/g.133741 Transcript_43907/m.133741 type:complete len:85 (-) Transcript_43907:235-489(-)
MSEIELTRFRLPPPPPMEWQSLGCGKGKRGKDSLVLAAVRPPKGAANRAINIPAAPGSKRTPGRKQETSTMTYLFIYIYLEERK